MRKVIAIIFIVSIIQLIGCATNPVTGKTEFMLVTESQEISIGKEYSPKAEKEFGGVVKDRELNNYVNEVGQKLAKASDRKNIKYHYKVVNSNVVNAFALPGGYIYITRGLLIKLNNEAQLAAVLGHETGHVAARHSAKQISDAMGMSVLLQAGVIAVASRGSAEAGTNAKAVAMLGDLIGSMILLGYSRDAEYQADLLGAEYCYRAGYHPRAMEQVLEILKKLDKKKASGTDEYFQSHPTTKHRIDEVDKKLQKKYKDADDKGLTYGEESFKKRTKKFRDSMIVYEKLDKAKEETAKGNHPTALSILDEAVAAQPDNEFFYLERAKTYLASGEHKKAEQDFLKAKQLDPENFDALLGYGIERYKNRDYETAENDLTSASKIISSEISCHYYLGETKLALDKMGEARKELETVITLAKEFAKNGTSDEDTKQFAERAEKRLREARLQK
ncbi:MAG: hypothetical protein A2W23_03900 [Planctomycetes bacterium RBG_16_43_13]|nr:MAG: hypothetical protein A2W23_03900 [Planctomycetes bacterium RBG_16_43_13]